MAEKLSIVCRKEILGKEINFYGSVQNPYFLPSEIAEWLNIKNHRQMIKTADLSEDQKGVFLIDSLGGEQETTMLTEDGLYDVLMLSRKPLAKPLKKEIKQYLKSIRLTGAAIPEGNEEKMVNYYFSNLSSDLQGKIVNELMEKNRELQQFYDDLLSTEGLYSMNTTAKELKIGRNTLFAYLRGKSIMFYQDNSNVPYQRFMNQGLFRVIESPCPDGKYHPTTYATKKGLEYIRRLLHNDGYYAEVI